MRLLNKGLNPKSVLNIYNKAKFFSSYGKNHIWGVNKEADISEFKRLSEKITYQISDFHHNLTKQRVIPDVKPNFLKDKLSQLKAPRKGQSVDSILDECNNEILNYMTLWNHPGFLNWYPSMTSFPAMLGNLTTNVFQSNGDSWKFNASIYETEKRIMNWLTDILNLPKNFRGKTSGGVVHYAAGECSVVAALVGKTYKSLSNPGEEHKFVFYYSSQAHYSVKKGINIAGYDGREIPTKWSEEMQNYTMNIEKLEEAIEKDVNKGLIPAYICGTLGTTSTSALDDCKVIGEIAEKYKMWFHVDAAYSGNTFMLDEYKDLANSTINANSLVVNGNKWMPVSENAGFFFTSDYNTVVKTFNQNPDLTNAISNFNDWEIMTTRCNKSVRLYLTLSTFGKEGLRNIVSRTISSAKIFEQELEKYPEYFEFVCKTRFALVCFRLKGKTVEENDNWYKYINSKDRLSIGPYVIPDVPEDKSYVLRISINYVFVSDAQTIEDSKYLVQEYKNYFNIK